MMLTFPNLLSFLRIPLAAGFLCQDQGVRFLVVVLAMVTDSADGFLARRSQQATQFGAMLDPLADKFFMLVALSAFLFEGCIYPWQMAALLSRDFAVMIFGIYLGLSGGWATYKLRAIWAGKVSTTLQFLVLLALLGGITPPEPFYWSFVVLGALALSELYFIRQWDRGTYINNKS